MGDALGEVEGNKLGEVEGGALREVEGDIKGNLEGGSGSRRLRDEGRQGWHQHAGRLLTGGTGAGPDRPRAGRSDPEEG